MFILGTTPKVLETEKIAYLRAFMKKDNGYMIRINEKKKRIANLLLKLILLQLRSLKELAIT